MTLLKKLSSDSSAWRYVDAAGAGRGSKTVKISDEDTEYKAKVVVSAKAG